MSERVDAVIVGAGLSGLSLAAHLADGTWRDRHVLIVDDASRSVRESSWALWTRDPGWLAPAVTASWDTIAVASSTDVRRLAIAPYQYHTISGAHLADIVHDRVSLAQHFQFVTGTVEEVADGVEAATVRVDGVDIRTRWVFDSRGVTSTRGGPFLQFLGWEVESRTDVFDPGVVTFMDFRGCPKGRVSFDYVLPTTARRALVEVAEYRWTTGARDLTDALERYLREVTGLECWTIQRKEAGILPLSDPPHRLRDGRVVPIGTRAGMVKPSSGFALDRVQRHSAAITSSLVQQGHPHDVPTTRRRHAWLDDVFLEVLRTHPNLVEPVFARLFERNPASDVLRFLDEDTTIAQEARLVSTLPQLPFLRAGLSSIRSRHVGD